MALDFFSFLRVVWPSSQVEEEKVRLNESSAHQHDTREEQEREWRTSCSYQVIPVNLNRNNHFRRIESIHTHRYHETIHGAVCCNFCELWAFFKCKLTASQDCSNWSEVDALSHE